jgi:hypothetical protein
MDYSTKNISPKLIGEIATALKSIDSFGSIEIYVQDCTVTQITVRNIKKTQRKTNLKPSYQAS